MTQKSSFSSWRIERRFVISLSLTHISNIPRLSFIVVDVTPTLQFTRRNFTAGRTCVNYRLVNIDQLASTFLTSFYN